MELLFRTKEEANKQQQEHFLSLTPAERFYAFLALSGYYGSNCASDFGRIVPGFTVQMMPVLG